MSCFISPTDPNHRSVRRSNQNLPQAPASSTKWDRTPTKEQTHTERNSVYTKGRNA